MFDLDEDPYDCGDDALPPPSGPSAVAGVADLESRTGGVVSIECDGDNDGPVRWYHAVLSRPGDEAETTGAGRTAEAAVEQLARLVRHGARGPMTLDVLDDGDVVDTCTLNEFVAENQGLADEEIDAIAALAVGEVYESGGGAGASWAVRRAS